jgi:hypothetical protein
VSAPEIHNLDATSDLKPVRVVIRQLDYITKGINPLGQEVDRIATAYGPGDQRLDPANRPDLDPESQEYADAISDYQHGQLILLRPAAYIGLISSGAVRDVQTDESGEEVIEDEEVLDVNSASVEELADWIRTERPTVNDVIKASDGNPEVAQKLLEAESIAQNGEPRNGVLRGLSAVISRG